jgi:hypothetical protein
MSKKIWNAQKLNDSIIGKYNKEILKEQVLIYA